jgi:hypothetical protein
VEDTKKEVVTSPPQIKTVVTKVIERVGGKKGDRVERGEQGIQGKQGEVGQVGEKGNISFFIWIHFKFF